MARTYVHPSVRSPEILTPKWCHRHHSHATRRKYMLDGHRTRDRGVIVHAEPAAGNLPCLFHVRVA